MERKATEMMLEFDLAGAEWVVVAHLSGDANMLGVVESGKSPHVVTGSLISKVPEELVIKENKIVGGHTDEVTIRQLRYAGCPEIFDLPGTFLPRVMSIRQAGKKSNHGLNYDMKFRRFALENEIPEAEAKLLVDAYTQQAYPGIPLWHKAIREELRQNRRVMTNCFGRKVKLMGQWGQDLFNQAYSFKPQSTVVDSCLQAMYLIYDNKSPEFSRVRLSAQTHDSIMVQHPIPTSPDEWYSLSRMIALIGFEYMRPPLEYSDIVFRLSCDLKVGVNWGHMEPVRMSPDAATMRHNLEQAVYAVQQQSGKHDHLAPAPEELPEPMHQVSA